MKEVFTGHSMTGLAPIMHRNSEKLMTPSPFLSTTFIISSASSMLHTCTTMVSLSVSSVVNRNKILNIGSL